EKQQCNSCEVCDMNDEESKRYEPQQRSGYWTERDKEGHEDDHRIESIAAFINGEAGFAHVGDVRRWFVSAVVNRHWETTCANDSCGVVSDHMRHRIRAWFV